jgi:hypothetical protein
MLRGSQTARLTQHRCPRQDGGALHAGVFGRAGLFAVARNPHHGGVRQLAGQSAPALRVLHCPRDSRGMPPICARRVTTRPTTSRRTTISGTRRGMCASGGTSPATRRIGATVRPASPSWRSSTSWTRTSRASSAWPEEQFEREIASQLAPGRAHGPRHGHGPAVLSGHPGLEEGHGALLRLHRSHGPQGRGDPA